MVLNRLMREAIALAREALIPGGEDGEFVLEGAANLIGLDQLKFSDRQSLEPRAGVIWSDPEQYGCYWYAE